VGTPGDSRGQRVRTEPLPLLEFLTKVAHRRDFSKRAAQGSIPAASTIEPESHQRLVGLFPLIPARPRLALQPAQIAPAALHTVVESSDLLRRLGRFGSCFVRAPPVRQQPVIPGGAPSRRDHARRVDDLPIRGQ
jgi:hypothetical protein